MRKNNKSIFYYFTFLKQEKKFFVITFFIFISFSAIHYFFFNANNYRVEITHILDSRKIINPFKIKSPFHPRNYYYEDIFYHKMELELLKAEIIIIDYFDNLLKKKITNFNRSARYLNYKTDIAGTRSVKYIIEINDINNIDKLEKILNDERNSFQEKILKFISSSLFKIFYDINISQHSQLTELKLDLQIINNLLEYTNKNNLNTDVKLIRKIFTIKQQIENLESALNAEKNSYDYIYALNYNLVDFTISYTNQRTPQLLKLLIYIFLSFTLSIIIILIRLSYKNYK